MKILLVEDDKLIRITLRDELRKKGHSVEVCDDGQVALQKVTNDDYHVVITDLRLPGASGIEILKLSKKMFPGREIITITAYASVETAVDALRLGAYDYFIKPFSSHELIHSLDNIEKFQKLKEENTILREKLKHIEKREMVGTSPAIRKLLETIRIVSPQDFNVLITGESGTGKELAARTLHSYSPRATQPFIAVNCAVIPETLLESELFGYEKGSFSGATRQHIGYFERANKGVLFIDDIDDLPLPFQVKLLRVLQERELSRLGSSSTIPVDIRVICASKVDLGEMVEAGKFRDDLYYRINVVPLEIPPLRDRREDIPHLFKYFLELHNADAKTMERANGLLDQLLAYDWPGNIRELRNIVQRIIALPGITDLQLTNKNKPLEQDSENWLAGDEETSDPDCWDFDKVIDKKSAELINKALEKTKGNVSQAAKLLNIPRSTLRHKLQKTTLCTDR